MPLNLWLKCSVVSNSLQPARFLCPWIFPGKNTGMGCHCLLQGIFLTQGSNPGLLHCRQILYQLNHKGSQCENRINSKCVCVCMCVCVSVCVCIILSTSIERERKIQFSSVAQSYSNSLRPHGLQQPRPPCPLPTLSLYSNSCPFSQ